MSKRTPGSRLQKQLQAARRGPCEYCQSDKTLLRRTIAGSGVVMYFWLCGECGRNARKQNIWISHQVIEAWVQSGRLESPEAIPLHVSYAEDCRCVVCNQPGAEYHHWAPQSLAAAFGEDWQQWPGDYLCKMHHDQWHNIVTPYMPGRNGAVVLEWVGASHG